MVNKEFDVLVVGGGPAGENAADYAARDGLEVALIEGELLGGECSYWACMPSKGLLRPGEALNEASRVPGTSAAIDGELDLEAAFERRDALSSHWDDEHQEEWLETTGVELIRGWGRLTGTREVTVSSDGTETSYTARMAVVLATGSAASIPPIDGLDEIEAWDNRDITTTSEVPKRLLIIGGGVVGVEMAQAWKDLGSDEVTILELADSLLVREEPFVGVEIRKSLERRGVVVHTSAETKEVTRSRNGPVMARVVLDSGEEKTIEADEILVAAGRRPNTDRIGLDSVGLEPGKTVDVNDHLMATGVDGGWLFAVGDVNGRSLLTHTGKYQARILGDRLNGKNAVAWGDMRATPRVIFTSPEVGAVGKTEAQAVEAGLEVETVMYDIGKTAAAPIVGKGYGGTCKLVIDADAQVIVGATFVGPRVGEMIHAATIAIVGEVPIGTLWHAIPSFPTLSEVWLRLLENYREESGGSFPTGA